MVVWGKRMKKSEKSSSWYVRKPGLGASQKAEWHMPTPVHVCSHPSSCDSFPVPLTCTPGLALPHPETSRQPQQGFHAGKGTFASRTSPCLQMFSLLPDGRGAERHLLSYSVCSPQPRFAIAFSLASDTLSLFCSKQWTGHKSCMRVRCIPQGKQGLLQMELTIEKTQTASLGENPGALV